MNSYHNINKLQGFLLQTYWSCLKHLCALYEIMSDEELEVRFKSHQYNMISTRSGVTRLNDTDLNSTSYSIVE